MLIQSVVIGGSRVGVLSGLIPLQLAESGTLSDLAGITGVPLVAQHWSSLRCGSSTSTSASYCYSMLHCVGRVLFTDWLSTINKCKLNNQKSQILHVRCR